MKKTHFLDLLKNIKTNIVSFTAIVLFVSLGIALFCGLSFIKYSTNGYVDEIYREGKVHTLELTFPLGADEEGISELAELPEVEAAEGIRSINGSFSLGGSRYQANIRELSYSVDIPMFTDGVLPEKSDEIAVEAQWAKKHGVKLGDTLTFYETDDKGAAGLAGIMNFGEATASVGGVLPLPLRSDTFKVTALLENASFFEAATTPYGMSQANRLPINCIMFVSSEAFAPEAFSGYSTVLLRGKGISDTYAFSQKYKDKEKVFEDAVKGKAEEISAERYDIFAEKAEQIELFTGVSVNTFDGEPQVAVIPSSSLYCYVFCEGMNKVQRNSGLTLASLFVAVGLFVCYSALSRIINDQSSLIGTKKALGISEREIRLFYFGFSGIALLMGVIIGVLLAVFVVEPIILKPVAGAFVVRGCGLSFSVKETVLIVAVEAFFIFFATWIAVKKTLKRSAMSLMLGSQENLTKTGFYEKTRLYKRLGLLSQIIVNNFFKDRRRVIGTVIGIIGSTALVVTAFTYQSVVSRSFAVHYDTIYHFDTVLTFDGRSREVEKGLSEKLDEEGVENAAILSEKLYIQTPSGKTSAADLFVPVDEAEYKKLVTPNEVSGKGGDVYKGVWLSRAFQKEHGLKKGDVLEFISIDGEKRSVAVSGFAEHYLMNVQCYMDRELYEELFGRTAEANAFIADRGEKSVGELSSLAEELELDCTVSDYKQDSKLLFDVIGDLSNTMVGVYFLLAVAMSVLVLLNLLSMFVSEKKKEILVLRINGYSLKDAKRYIYSDTILLTAVGVVLGVLFGELFGNVSATAYESQSGIFKYGFKWQAAVLGAVISIVLTLIMSAISLRKIGKYELTDINNQS